MGRTILSNAVSKIGQPISEENDERRKTAIKDIAACLERCYREFFKYNAMKNSQSQRMATEAFTNEEKMVSLINELKSEVNRELLRIACFSGIDPNSRLCEEILERIDETIVRYTDTEERDHSEDLAKTNVRSDFEEMKKTMQVRSLDHIRTYPFGVEKRENPRKNIVPLVQPTPNRRLAPWQMDVMSGRDTGFFADAVPYVDEQEDEKVVDLDEYRRRKNGEER